MISAQCALLSASDSIFSKSKQCKLVKNVQIFGYEEKGIVMIRQPTRVEKLDFSRNETRRKLSFSSKPFFLSCLSSIHWTAESDMRANHECKQARAHTRIQIHIYSRNLRISILRSQQLFSALNFVQRYGSTHCQRFCEQHMCYFKHFNVRIGRERRRNRQCISKFEFSGTFEAMCSMSSQPSFLSHYSF